jgi:hypothetical protein
MFFLIAADGKEQSDAAGDEGHHHGAGLFHDPDAGMSEPDQER